MRTLPTLSRICVLFLQLAFIAGCGSNMTSPNSPSTTQDSLSIQPSTSSVAVGGTVALQATLATNGTTQNVTGQTTWSVSDASIASIENNILQTKAVGSVTVNGNFNGSSTASTLLTITPAASVITWPSPAAVPAATKLSATQLNATANVPGTFTYDPAAGTVLQSGTQTLKVNFTPSDPKTYSAETATTTINVANAGAAPPSQTATLTAVQISGSPTSVQSGQTIPLVATAIYSDNSTAVVTSTATWQSSNLPLLLLALARLAVLLQVPRRSQLPITAYRAHLRLST